MASAPARVVGDQTPVALPAVLPAHLTDSLVADLQAGDAAATSSLAAALAAVPDARRRRGRWQKLTGVLAIGACACLTGATSYVAMASGPLRRAEPCWIVSAGAAQPGCCRARRRCVAACRAPI